MRKNPYHRTGDGKCPGILTTVERLNELNQYCLQNGARLYVAGYPIGYGQYTPSESEFEKFQSELENKLDFPVISDFTDYFFDYSYFYDTNLHMTTDGAKLRTEQLIEDMRANIF